VIICDASDTHAAYQQGIQLPNLIGTLCNSLQNQEDEDAFERHRDAAVQVLNKHFGQDFGVPSLQRRIRPVEPYAGLAGDQLVVPNSVFGGNIQRFAEVAFGLVRPVSYLFSNA